MTIKYFFCQLGIVLWKCWNEFCYLNLLETLNSKRLHISIKHYKTLHMWINPLISNIEFIDTWDLTNQIWVQQSSFQMWLFNIIYLYFTQKEHSLSLIRTLILFVVEFEGIPEGDNKPMIQDYKRDATSQPKILNIKCMNYISYIFTLNLFIIDMRLNYPHLNLNIHIYLIFYNL